MMNNQSERFELSRWTRRGRTSTTILPIHSGCVVCWPPTMATSERCIQLVLPESVQALTQSGRGRGYVRGDPSSVGTAGDVLDELYG